MRLMTGRSRASVYAAVDATFRTAACLAVWAGASAAAGYAMGQAMPGSESVGSLVGSAVAVAATHRIRARLCGPLRPPRPWVLVYDGWPSLAFAAMLAARAMAAGAPDVGLAFAQATLAAVTEEMVFRLAMPSALASLGPVVACVGSSAAFALAHALGVAPALVPIRAGEALSFGLFLSTGVCVGGGLADAVGYHLVFDLALGLAEGGAAPPWVLLLTWGGIAVQLGAVGACRLAELRGCR